MLILPFRAGIWCYPQLTKETQSVYLQKLSRVLKKESDFNFGPCCWGAAVSAEPHLTPSFTAVTVVTLTFSVSPWEHSLGLLTLWPHTHTHTRTHRKVSVCVCANLCKHAHCSPTHNTWRQATKPGDHRWGRWGVCVNVTASDAAKIWGKG